MKSVVTLSCLIVLSFAGQALAGFRIHSASGASAEIDVTHRGARNDRDFSNEHFVHHFFMRFDANQDISISVREAPEWMRIRFGRVDSNRDGVIVHSEYEKMLNHHHQGLRPRVIPPKPPRYKPRNGRSLRY
ncbi:MAG: hypothetical protein JKY95_07530 [Planctomycetaceae bacterium]|nr:hypothetical protein [Planctomycetaceae bacterium]